MTFEEIVKMTQPELWSALFDYYNEHLCSFVEGDYLSIMGDIPVMLVAHLDTVHHEQVKHICKSEDGNIIMSPEGIGGDDRCGVYALMEVYRTMPEGMKPYLLFTCDEETGDLWKRCITTVITQNLKNSFKTMGSIPIGEHFPIFPTLRRQWDALR